MFCIAICDDEDYFCIKEKELVAGFMDRKGYPYRIDIFRSGRELLDSLNLISQYNVIFLDVNMRELDGIETAKKYTIYAKLDDMDELLRGAGFCRLHKSYLVNSKYVESIKRYQAGLCIVVDYISILGMSRCFPVITTERLHEPLVIMLLGILSQMLLVCLIMLLRRYAVKKSSEMLTTMEWLRFAVFPLFTILVLAAL